MILHFTHSNEETTFLDVVQTENHTVSNATIQLNLTFKVDTGAKLTAISHTVFEQLSNVNLQQSTTRSLEGPARQKLEEFYQLIDVQLNRSI